MIPKHTPTRLGAALRHAREQRGISRTTVGEALHVDPSLVTRWETGARPLPAHHAEAYADYLELDVMLIRRRT